MFIQLYNKDSKDSIMFIQIISIGKDNIMSLQQRQHNVYTNNISTTVVINNKNNGSLTNQNGGIIINKKFIQKTQHNCNF